MNKSKKPEHVEQNLKILDIPPMDEAQYKEAIQILLESWNEIIRINSMLLALE